jgi:carbon monoxide dehydrogenase subunit G
MDMQGQRTLNANQQQAWDALNNPEILKACIPGCEKFEMTDDGSYAVTTAIKIGPVAARFSGKVTLTDIVPPTSYRLNFDAQGGIAGFGKGLSSVELKPLEHGCELHYTVHSSVGGKIAQLGQRLIDGVAKSLAEDFFKRFEAELKRLYPAPGDPSDLETHAAALDSGEGVDSPSRAVLPTWGWLLIAAGIAVIAWRAAL